MELIYPSVIVVELIYPSVIVELIYLRVLLWNLFTRECFCGGTCLPESVIVVELIYLRLLLWNLFT